MEVESSATSLKREFYAKMSLSLDSLCRRRQLGGGKHSSLICEWDVELVIRIMETNIATNTNMLHFNPYFHSSSFYTFSLFISSLSLDSCRVESLYIYFVFAVQVIWRREMSKLREIFDYVLSCVDNNSWVETSPRFPNAKAFLFCH